MSAPRPNTGTRAVSKLDRRCLTAIIRRQDITAMMSYGVKDTFFQGNHKLVASYLMQHFKRYHNLPTMSTIQTRFPWFKPIKADDGLEYYVNQIRERELFQRMEVTLMDAQAKLVEGSALQAYQHVADLMRTTNAQIISPTDMTLANEADNQVLEYERTARGDIEGITTGFHLLDQNIMCYECTDFIVIAASAGCLVGNTEIRLNRAGKGFTTTIKNAYEKFHGGGRNGISTPWDLSIPTYARSYHDKTGLIQLNLVQDVIYSGVKKVYRLSLDNGQAVVLTDDHPVLTRRGFVKACDVVIGIDEVMVDRLTRHQSRGYTIHSAKLSYLRKRVGPYYPARHWDRRLADGGDAFIANVHRLVVEADMNCMTVDALIAATYDPNVCSYLQFLTASEVVHHRDGNHRNNELSNLEVLSNSEHMKRHTSGYAGFGHGVPLYVTASSFVYVGEEKTYDISMQAPHNFVADGMVVHNCGKTWYMLMGLINILLAGNKVLLFSKEMKRRTIIRRALALLARVPYKNIRHGTLDEIQRERLDRAAAYAKIIGDNFVVIGDDGFDNFAIDDYELTNTLDFVEAKIEQYQPDIVGIDGFYLLSAGNAKKRMAGWEETSFLTRRGKRIANRMGVPIIVTTQLNREASKTKKPGLDHIGYASSFGQDADIVQFLTGGKEMVLENERMITFPKVREGEPCPNLILNFNPAECIDIVDEVDDAELDMLEEE